MVSLVTIACGLAYRLVAGRRASRPGDLLLIVLYWLGAGALTPLGAYLFCAPLIGAAWAAAGIGLATIGDGLLVRWLRRRIGREGARAYEETERARKIRHDAHGDDTMI